MLIPILACLFLVSPALAADPKPTAAQIAAGRAEADRLIAAAGAGDLFTNVSDSEVPQVRHRRSGMVCGFEPGNRDNAIVVFDNASVPRGDDVGCRTVVLGNIVIVYATRFPGLLSAEQARDGAVEAIRKTFQNVTPYREQGISMNSDALPTVYAARFYGEANSQRRYIEVKTAKREGWNYKLRLTGPIDEIMASQLLAEVTMTALLLGVVERPGQD